jgi:hypothetical protein
MHHMKGEFLEQAAEEVLKEVPDQFVEYMIQKKIMPEPSFFNPSMQ